MSDTATDLMKKPASSFSPATRPRRYYPRSRAVRDLRWAEYLNFRPFGKKRLNSSQRAGMRFEAKFGTMLRASLPKGTRIDHERWIEFEDANGNGYACPDWVVFAKRKILLFETKLSWYAEAWRQPVELYAPLLTKLEDLPVVSILAFKNPAGYEAWLGNQGRTMQRVSNLIEAVKLEPSRVGFWHWLPR